MSLVGAISVPSPLKTGTNLLDPLPPQSLNGESKQDFDTGVCSGKGENVGRYNSIIIVHKL